MKEMLNIEAAIAIVEYLSRQQNRINTIRQIAKEIRINHMTVTRTIKKLAAMKAVSFEKIGPSYVVKLHKTPQVFGLLSLSNSYKTKDVNQIITKAKHAYEEIK